MNNIDEYIKYVTNVKPSSINSLSNGYLLMQEDINERYLIAIGDVSDEFIGEMIMIEEFSYKKCPLIHENAVVLRKILPFTAPVKVLRNKRTIGLGDRLGIATSGHIRLFKIYDAYPVFAQQSIRELTLTKRTFDDVLDCVTFSVFENNYRKGYGADGDHLKKPEEIEYAISSGYTMITLDCSEYINNNVTKEDVKNYKVSQELQKIYLSKPFTIEQQTIEFSIDELAECELIYGKAIEFASLMYKTYFKNNGPDFEISIDETLTPTTPHQHFFVANELNRRDVDFITLAPRFCGEFQKGVDYIGDLHKFEQELVIHTAISRHFGYKLSIHSGSDKFSTFELIGKYTKGNFHVKTAGTNWLVAMELIAKTNPCLYREVHQYALEKFNEATNFYHVTTDLTKIPILDNLKDEELVTLFRQNDARQLIHITYGYILTAQDKNGKYLFKDRLYKEWYNRREEYATMLEEHLGHHLQLLYKGFKKNGIY